MSSLSFCFFSPSVLTLLGSLCLLQSLFLSHSLFLFHSVLILSFYCPSLSICASCLFFCPPWGFSLSVSVSVCPHSGPGCGDVSVVLSFAPCRRQTNFRRDNQNPNTDGWSSLGDFRMSWWKSSSSSSPSSPQSDMWHHHHHLFQLSSPLTLGSVFLRERSLEKVLFSRGSAIVLLLLSILLQETEGCPHQSLLLVPHVSQAFRLSHDSSVSAVPATLSCRTGNKFFTFFPKLPLLLLLSFPSSHYPPSLAAAGHPG